MGLGLSLYTVSQLARHTVIICADAVTGRVTRETIDDRCRTFAHSVIEHAAIDLVVRGRELVPADRAYVYMSNHQSHIDIPVLYASIPSTTVRMVAKSELFRIPLWGQAMRAGDFIEVDRSDHERAVASINRAAELIDDGVSIWIAPEGTRSPTGAIGPLKKGGFHLAMQTSTPIVPIAIDGTRRILPKGGRFMQSGVRVTVTFGAPIDTRDRDMNELMDAVREFFVAHVTV